MIKFSAESPVNCETCGKPAIRRTVEVHHPGKGGRMVSYDTHSRCLTDRKHFEALLRVERFHKRVHDLIAQLRALPAADRALKPGRIVDFDFETVHPTACRRRELVIATAIVQAFGLRGEVRLDARPLKGQSAARILRDLRTAAVSVVQYLRRRRDEGDF
jgi:hypothetical protein